MARTMTSTTISASITSSATQIPLTSASGVLANQILFCEREAMLVLADPVLLVAQVMRGVQGTAARGHYTGTTIWNGPPNAYAFIDPSGLIGPTPDIYLPRVVIPSGKIWNDNGSGVWEEVGGGGSGTLTGPAGSATLNFPSIPDGGVEELTFTVTGALVNDKVAPSWPSALDTGLSGSMFVSASNTITVRLINLSGDAVNPAALAYGAQIVRAA